MTSSAPHDDGRCPVDSLPGDDLVGADRTVLILAAATASASDGSLREHVDQRSPCADLSTRSPSEYDERALASLLPPLPALRSAARAVDDAVAGFGPLQRHLDDPSLEEIWINEPGRVFVARGGRRGGRGLRRPARRYFLSVLTAPAGAGKTSTLGAAARAWQDAGYRVVGLAPSARAAAELATATGGPADTLAKWLHTHHHTHPLTPPGAPAATGATGLDARTVVIMDEASMAGTLDLDPLIAAAARAGAKVVLVGDPAQIGVVNGPGGMLAALASAGHAVELAEIHRFSQPWERSASLALRHGKADVLSAYRGAGRLHPCQDGDAALESVFGHWAAARAEGQDALMLARTRQDVDALNLRARAAALAASETAGPVTVAGGRDWQAGDVLRARRNDRRLVVGDGHVRNGDSYQVLGPGPQDGLIVADLTGRGRTVLPAAYLAEHAEYGWASTIDAAQGATADVAIVLVRSGIDREHLYVAMTRGRHGNHAYITPDPATDDDHHGHPHQRHSAHTEADPQEQAVRVLEAALARSGAQDAAHTALEHARAQAVHTARQNQQRAERAAAREAVAAELQRRQARPLLPEHARAVQRLKGADGCAGRPGG